MPTAGTSTRSTHRSQVGDQPAAGYLPNARATARRFAQVEGPDTTVGTASNWVLGWGLMNPKLPALILPVLGLWFTLAAEAAAQTVQPNPHDSLIHPSANTLSGPSPISGSMSDAWTSIRSMKWIGARKGLLRIGVLRTLRFDGCRIQIATDRGWNQVRDWLEAASLSKEVSM